MKLIKTGDIAATGKSRSFTERRFFHAVVGNLLAPLVNPVWALRILNFLLAVGCCLNLVLLCRELRMGTFGA